jgi:serine/threonine protein kinase
MNQERTTREWPSLFGEFRVLGPLGVGPCATTLKVRMIGDPERRGEMALKVFHTIALPAWKAVAQLDDAVIQAIRANPHDGLALTYEFGQLVDDVFVLQQYVDGMDLRTLLTLFPEPLGELPLRARLGIAVQLAAALEHLHSVRFGDDGKARLVHGDLCPANVMIGRDGIVRLMDLGFCDTARAVIRPAMEGSVMGSPGFLAPEQLSGRRATPATDVYAFGAVLGQLLLGRPLFRGAGPADVIEQSLAADLGDLASQLEAIHPGAGRIVQRAVTPARKGRILDGVLLVGEMFAVGLTDPADEVLTRIVGEAMDVADARLVPRELSAADGVVVNIHDGAIGADATMFEEPSLDEPSYESGTYEDYSADFPTPSTEYDPLATADADPPEELESDEESGTDPLPSLELEAAEEPAVTPRYESATVPSKVSAEPSPAKAPAAKKKGKGLTIGLIAAGLLMLIVCAGVSIPTVATLWLTDRSTESYDGPTIVHEGAREGASVGIPAEVTRTEDEVVAEEGEGGEEGEDVEDGETAEEDALADEEEIDEEPTPEPEPLTEEELQRQREEDERRREEREERDRKRAEERAEAEAEAARVSREDSLADADLDIDWGDVETDGDDEWLSGGSGGNPDDKIDIDIDALTNSAPEVAVPTSAPPKVRHTPIRSGRVDSTVSLKLTVTPNDSYTGIMYYRGAPSGSWASQDIAGGENGKITAKLYLGSWVSDDHDSVEYYFLVDGPGGSSGAGTRLSPYSFVLK